MIETKDNDVIFEESDPVGLIVCTVNELSFGGSELCKSFEEKLISLGFKGTWAYLSPPEGEFIDMRKAVGSEIIGEMLDFGIYPHQKQP